MFVKRSWPMFWIGAFICSPVFIFIGVAIIVNKVKGEDIPTGAVVFAALSIIVGLTLLIAAICTLVALKGHQTKLDKSAIVTYTVTYNDKSFILNGIDDLYEAIFNLKDKESLLIKPSQVYGGLSLWEIQRNQNWIFSFVTIQKKNGKEQKYFVMPKKNATEVARPFIDLYMDNKTLDYSQLIDMKRYNAVLEYYKLEK